MPDALASVRLPSPIPVLATLAAETIAALRPPLTGVPIAVRRFAGDPVFFTVAPDEWPRERDVRDLGRPAVRVGKGRC